MLSVFYVHGCFAWVHVCVPHAYSVCEGQKASVPLGQDLGDGCELLCGAENQT